MLCEMLQLQETLVDALSGCVVAWQSYSDYKFLLNREVLEVAIEYACKVVESTALHWQIKQDVCDVHMYAKVDLLLEDRL